MPNLFDFIGSLSRASQHRRDLVNRAVEREIAAKERIAAALEKQANKDKS